MYSNKYGPYGKSLTSLLLPPRRHQAPSDGTSAPCARTRQLSSVSSFLDLPLAAQIYPVMESNRDEAIKCLAIAQKHRDTGNLASAKRFCQKSLSLFTTPEGTKLLGIIETEIAEQPSSSSESSSSASGAAGSSTAFSSAAEAHPSASGTRHRHTESSSQSNSKANGSANGSAKAEDKKRDFTPEQSSMVKRIRACKVTEYYEILSLKKDCEEAEVKKAYRKV